jgi:hypothetical protein
MTLEFRDFDIDDARCIGELTKSRTEGFLPDPVYGGVHSNEGHLIYHLVKGTPEEIEEYRGKAQPKMEIKTAFDVKQACIFFAKNMKQYDPRKDALQLDALLKETPEKGYKWICTDKWKDLEEWTLLPEEIIEKIRSTINPVAVFDPVAFLKGLPEADLKKLLETVAVIVDPVSQKLIQKAAAAQPSPPSQPQSSPAG